MSSFFFFSWLIPCGAAGGSLLGFLWTLSGSVGLEGFTLFSSDLLQMWKKKSLHSLNHASQRRWNKLSELKNVRLCCSSLSYQTLSVAMERLLAPGGGVLPLLRPRDPYVSEGHIGKSKRFHRSGFLSRFVSRLVHGEEASFSPRLAARFSPLGAQRLGLCGHWGAPSLGRLAQLYLLLDGARRVVDERVDETGHWKNQENAVSFSAAQLASEGRRDWPVNTPPMMAHTPVRKWVSDLRKQLTFILEGFIIYS